MRSSPRTGRARFAAATALFCLMALTGCSDSDGGGGGGSSSTPATPTPSATPTASASRTTAVGQATLTIKNFAFSPAKLTVKAGEKVTVTNADSTTHTVTATGGGSFDTGDIAAGKTKVFTAPAKAGSYPYDCSIHPFMKGTLTVS